MSVHSTELAAAEAAVAARTAGPQDHDHWKRWKPDGLDSLERTLGEEMRLFFQGGPGFESTSC